MTAGEKHDGEHELAAVRRTAESAARAGAAVLKPWFEAVREPSRERDLGVETKARNDLVSKADRESERAIVEILRSAHPDHAILGEEGGVVAGSANAQWEWIVDPLDGTTNFLHGHPTWCVSIACRRRARLVAGVVYEPLAGNLFSAVRGGGAEWNGRPMRVSEPGQVEEAFLATGFPFRAHAALDLFLAVFRDVFFRVRAIRRCGSAALDLAYTAAGIYDGFFELRLSPWDVAAGALLVEEAGGVVTDLDGRSGYLLSGNLVAAAPQLQRELRRWINAHASEATVEGLVPQTPPPIAPLA